MKVVSFGFRVEREGIISMAKPKATTILDYMEQSYERQGRQQVV